MTYFDSLRNPRLRPPADSQALRALEVSLGTPLPNGLRRLLSESDGWSDETGLLFYGTGELLERNSAWETSTYAPLHLAIADDGGGRVALVIRDGGSAAVLVSDVGDMSPAGFQMLDNDLEAWVGRGCLFDTGKVSVSTIPAHSLVDVWLVRPLSNGLRDLTILRQSLGIERPIGELRERLGHLPLLLLERVPYGALSRKLEKLGETGSVLEIKKR